ncbi:hypothetical protein HMPREF9946_01704 [Acetobacteraceae bacterium AT-5844]|nr:hypothetical protein HMPREF9946_01704 [Acetobacteraceae bacterium AT-5844]
MMDPKSLLDQFLGPRGQSGGQGGGALGDLMNQLSTAATGQSQRRSGAGLPMDVLGGAAGGGLLGVLLGSGRRGGLGSVLSHGGAAALAALAYRAWQNYQQGQTAASAPPATAQDARIGSESFHPEAAPASFSLALIQALIGAAKADGHVDEEEQRAISTQVEQAGLDAEAKAFILDALSQPTDLDAIAAGVTTQEQASQLFLAVRLAINADQPSERAYLDGLAQRLNLPDGLIQHLSAQGDAALQGRAFI